MGLTPLPVLLGARLSPHFILAEMIKSSTADRLGIDNVPGASEVESLRDLCENILEPIRAHYGIPLSPSSGYRSKELNDRIGGSPSSQHTKGEAVDFEIPGHSNLLVARWVESHLPYDQLILEFFKKDVPSSGWIHVSRSEHMSPRMQVLTYDGKSWQSGLP
jgi:zinc D-Ala-D-Ala carboxypeptidase